MKPGQRLPYLRQPLIGPSHAGSASAELIHIQKAQHRLTKE